MNNSNQNDAGDEAVDVVEDTRPLSPSEDVELDVREAIEELKGEQPKDENNVDEGQEQGKAEEEGEAKIAVKAPAQQSPNVGPKAVDPAKETGPIAPPSTWSAKGKEWFNRQPPEAQRELAKRQSDMERQFHKVTTEAASVKREYSDIDEAVRPYEKEWLAKGVSRGQAIRSLCAANAYLEHDLPRGLEAIARSYGKTLQQVVDELEGGENGRSAHEEDPRLQKLLERISYLENEVNGVRQERSSKERSATLQELYSVRDETDSTGTYLRPELHDESFVQEQIAPRYRKLYEALPGATARQLILEAYMAATGKNPETIRAQAQANHREKARRASLSVRGSTVASKPQDSSSQQQERGEDTVRSVLRDLRGMS